MDVLMTAMQIVIALGIGYFVGKIIAGFVSAYFARNEEPAVIGSVSGDDVLDFDKSEVPFIPVRIIKEHNQYYAWFSVNEKFIGQAATIEEIRRAAYEQVLKQMGLRFEFTQEKTKAKPKTKKGP
jgi:hypothetical protein